MMPYNETTGVEQSDTDEPATPRTRSAIALAGVPALTGTPDAIESADAIRAAKLTTADEILTALRGGETLTLEHIAAAIPPLPVTHAQVQHMQAALNRLRHQTDAQWWLTYQHTPTQELLEAMMEAAPDAQSGGASAYGRQQ